MARAAGEADENRAPIPVIVRTQAGIPARAAAVGTRIDGLVLTEWTRSGRCVVIRPSSTSCACQSAIGSIARRSGKRW